MTRYYRRCGCYGCLEAKHTEDEFDEWAYWVREDRKPAYWVALKQTAEEWHHMFWCDEKWPVCVLAVFIAIPIPLIALFELPTIWRERGYRAAQNR